jgi:hypothetical protein
VAPGVAARLFWLPSWTGQPLGSHGHSSAFWAAVPTTWERPGPYNQEWTRAREGSLPDPVGGERPGRPSLMYRQWVRVTLANLESETRSFDRAYINLGHDGTAAHPTQRCQSPNLPSAEPGLCGRLEVTQSQHGPPGCSNASAPTSAFWERLVRRPSPLAALQALAAAAARLSRQDSALTTK